MKDALLAALAVLLLGLVAQAQAPPEMSDDPEVERKLLTLPEGFDLQLVAMEPAIINPVQINFDPQGRLWVLCIPRYPQLLPGQDPQDFITVLEDLDATGKARKATVFAEGLTVPTGMAPGDGGVYVGQADKLLHLRDTKGTGKADQRRVLLAGFGAQDTHHTLNSFRWGPDGNLYFNQGVYIKSTVETPYGPRRHWGGGIWQFRPDRLRLDVYDRSILGTNTWGHLFDPWGQSFCTTAWPDGVNLVLPDTPLNDANDKAVVPPLPITRVADGRHCGATFVSGRHFSEEWQGNLVSGSFAAQQVLRYAISDAGTKFVGKQLPPLVTSKHRKFRPVDVQLGPDGALYIADWYDEVIQHNQIDFRDPRRDHTRGRIWRVVAKDRPLLPIPKLVGVPIDAVLDQLKAPELWTRQQAKRALAERDAKEVAVQLATWVRRLDAQDNDLPRHLLEALWTCQTIDRVDADLLTRVLRSDEPRARAAATRVVGAWQDRLESPLSLLAIQAADPHPRVRLEAVLAAMRVPTPPAIETALLALDRPGDPLLDFALRKAAVVLKPYWYPEFEKGRLTFAGRARHLAFALQAVQAPGAVPHLVKLVRGDQIPRATRTDVLSLIALLGDAGEQGLVWDQILAKDRLAPSERTRLLEALGQAMRERKVQPAVDPANLASLFEGDPTVSAAALRLAGIWHQQSLRDHCNRLAAADDAGRCQAAVDALVDLGGPATIQQLESLAEPARPFAVRVQALVGLARLDAKRAAKPAANLLSQPAGAGQDLTPLFIAFLQRSGGAQALNESLQTSRPSLDAAKIGLRVINTLGVQTPGLTKTLHETAGVGARRKVTPEETQRLVALVKTQGDASRGEAIFRRSALACQQCHTIGGAGGGVGPDLSGIGASSQVDYLLESILLPSKVIREGYNTAHIVTNDGKAFSGIIVRESPQDLVLRTQSADELVIPVRTIDERAVGGSLMPDGLDQLLTDAELVDLVRFLSELGKPGPFAVSHLPAARRWQTLSTIPEDLARLAPPALGKSLGADPRLAWTTIFSQVSGALPLADVPAIPNAPFAVLRCQLEVVTPGRLTLAFDDPANLQIWIDGIPIEARDRLALELTAGSHRVDIRVDPPRRGNGALRCGLVDTPGSAAVARFVGGK